MEARSTELGGNKENAARDSFHDSPPPAPPPGGAGGSGRKRGPAQALQCNAQPGEDIPHSPGPPSKRWRLGSTPPPWQSPAVGSCGQAPGASKSCPADEPRQEAEPAATEEAAHVSRASMPSGQQPGEQAEDGPAEDGSRVARQQCLPDWCDKPLMLELPEDGEVEAFSYLPGHPLLALACEGQPRLLAKLLTDMGADPDARDSRGYTALHMACRHARMACVRVLLDAGADTAARDGSGHTPAQLAEEGGHADVAAMLSQHQEVQAALAEQKAQTARARAKDTTASATDAVAC